MDAATERALTESEELELSTTGRLSGRPHSVRLRFAYADGLVWLRTGERPPAADASGVRRRSSADRETDWLRNLEHDPSCRVRIGQADLEARYEPSTDRDADLKRAVALLRDKYGAEWVADWYSDMGRIPVKLRLR
ncbi:MAG TPA: nitroreductase/quinone reductase family protein [Candidatus Limnocylindria bacterium]|nr:nitroreductase/quinone reductase family protein [Candidatus Limnocylindria bacterium]